MIQGLSLDERTWWALGGILFLIPLSVFITHVLRKRSSDTKAITAGVVVAAWGMVFDLVLTFGIPMWMAVLGLTVLPALGTVYALGLLATAKRLKEQRGK